jgi:hypothetical protein
MHLFVLLFLGRVLPLLLLLFLLWLLLLLKGIPHLWRKGGRICQHLCCVTQSPLEKISERYDTVPPISQKTSSQRKPESTRRTVPVLLQLAEAGDLLIHGRAMIF